MSLISTKKLRKKLRKTSEKVTKEVGKRVSRLQKRLKQSSSPLRHFERIAYQVSHPLKVYERLKAGKEFTRDMDQEAAAKARDLKANGFVDVTSIIEKPLLEELDRYFHEVLDPRSATAHAVATHPFFFYLTNPDDLRTDNILIRFALQDRIVKVVSEYFGTLPILDRLSVNESRGLENKEWLASQLWHLDYAPTKQVALWCYFTDVETLDQGPFTFLPLSESRLIKNDFLPRRIRDEEITELGLDPKVQHVFGKRLTCFLVSAVQCYHMGSRLKPGQRRVAYICQYATPVSDSSRIKITAPVKPEFERVLTP